MTIEEKAKRYDEAIKRAKEMIKAMTNIGGVAKVDDIQYLFPELKESEDERIRKEIIDFVKSRLAGFEQGDRFIAWLEKQNPAWSEEDEVFVHGLIRGLSAKRDIHGHTTFSSDCIDITETINWLKSLKDKVRVQPWNMWISVDKEVYVKEPVLAQKKDKSDQFEGFVVCCDQTLTSNVYERYMILGYVVSHNTWKPTEEQMKAIMYAKKRLPDTEVGNYKEGVLDELYEQLKVL